MKQFIISQNIADHVGYLPKTKVTKVKELPDNYFIVRDGNGEEWQVGEEEIEAIDCKEGLQDLKVKAASIKSQHGVRILKDDKLFAQLYGREQEEVEANAAYIVKCVNERKALMDFISVEFDKVDKREVKLTKEFEALKKDGQLDTVTGKDLVYQLAKTIGKRELLHEIEYKLTKTIQP